uniref:Uncharacterized protein n=1 Tax=Geobacter metallireducens TaxID=28232 RepID=A0A831XEY6_GEOME
MKKINYWAFMVATLVFFQASWASGQLVRDTVYSPRYQIALTNQRLQASTSDYVYQIAQMDRGFGLVVFSISPRTDPLFSDFATIGCKRAMGIAVDQQTDTLYILVERKEEKFGNKCMVLMLDIRENPGFPKPFTWKAVPDDANAMALADKQLVVVGNSFINVYDVKKPDMKKPVEWKLSRSLQKPFGYKDVAKFGKYFYALRDGAIDAYELGPNWFDRISVSETSPFAQTLLPVLDFNGGFILALGSSQSLIVERFPYDQKPKMEVRTSCEAFAINDIGKLERTTAPTIPNQEELILTAVPDNDRSTVYFLVWKYHWDNERKWYNKTQVLRVYQTKGNHWRLTQEVASNIELPALMLPSGDDLFVYGYDLNEQPKIEGFKVK